jgi:hypothetical protein
MRLYNESDAGRLDKCAIEPAKGSRNEATYFGNSIVHIIISRQRKGW